MKSKTNRLLGALTAFFVMIGLLCLVEQVSPSAEAAEVTEVTEEIVTDPCATEAMLSYQIWLITYTSLTSSDWGFESTSMNSVINQAMSSSDYAVNSIKNKFPELFPCEFSYSQER